jgi:hypothetical protein
MEHPSFLQSTLYDKTLDLLKNRPITMTLRRIADDTGLPESWLLKILSKRGLHPSVHRVQCLYEYLSGKPLSL